MRVFQSRCTIAIVDLPMFSCIARYRISPPPPKGPRKVGFRKNTCWKHAASIAARSSSYRLVPIALSPKKPAVLQILCDSKFTTRNKICYCTVICYRDPLVRVSFPWFQRHLSGQRRAHNSKFGGRSKNTTG